MASATQNANNVVEMAQVVNQANQAMTKVSAAIPQEAKNYMKTAKEKILDSDKLRSFSVFFGIGEDSAYSVALSPTILCPRLKHNILFFYLNYILLAAVVFAITLLATMLNPMTLVILAALAAAWFVVIRATSEGSVTIIGITISRKTASLIMMIISGIVGFFMVKDIFFITLGSSAGIALIHAVFRDASNHRLDETSSNATAAASVPLEQEMA